MSTSVSVAVTLVAVMCLSSVSCLPHDVIRQQRHELKNLACEPKATMVRIAAYLEHHNALADKVYFPEVVSVNRCLENCSFCGSLHLGVSSGPCQPDPKGIVQRRVYAYYYEGTKQKFQEVLVPEHTACKCPN